MKDYNQFYFNPITSKDVNTDPDKFLQMYIDNDFELELNSASNTYVVFDGTTQVLYKGDMTHCFIYFQCYKKYRGFEPVICSIESYDKMMETIKNNQNEDPKFKSFWDYVDSLLGNEEKWTWVMRLGTKFHEEGKNPDDYLNEIIEIANKEFN